MLLEQIVSTYFPLFFAAEIDKLYVEYLDISLFMHVFNLAVAALSQLRIFTVRAVATDCNVFVRVLFSLCAR